MSVSRWRVKDCIECLSDIDSKVVLTKYIKILFSSCTKHIKKGTKSHTREWRHGKNYLDRCHYPSEETRLVLRNPFVGPGTDNLHETNRRIRFLSTIY